MILAIKSADIDTSLVLLDENNELARKDWQPGRQLSTELLPSIQALLGNQKVILQDLTGLIVYQGPGSFTSLRIGITTMNALAYALSLPIVGVVGDDWLQDGLEQIKSTKLGQIILPVYGADANITKQKK